MHAMNSGWQGIYYIELLKISEFALHLNQNFFNFGTVLVATPTFLPNQ